MDGENRKVVNGGSSADGDTSAVFTQVDKPCQSQYFDVEEDVNEELASPKKTDCSEVTIKALEEEIQGLQHRMKEMECSEAGTCSLAARVTELEGELAHREKDLVLISSKAKDAFASADSLHLIAEALEADKAVLEARFRDLEARMGDLELKNLKAVEDALRKEEVIKSLNIELDVERGKTITAEKEKDDKVFKMEEELKKWKKAMKMEIVKCCSLLRVKGDEIAHLNEELVFAREKANMDGIEKEKARAMTLQKDYEINSLQEKLKNAFENFIHDAVYLKETRRVTLAHLEEVNVFLKEELRLAWENAREQLEMKKKAVAALAEKETEVLSLKQEMLLVREKVMDELEAENMEVVANKEAENFLVKERLNQRVVDVRMKNANLEKEFKHLKDMNSELEGKIKGFQFKDNDDVLVRGTYLTDGERPKISWVSAAAVVASSGTIAAVIAFCLHPKKQS